MAELASYDIALDKETYAANAHLPAMRDFFSEVNKEAWFERINGRVTGNTVHEKGSYYDRRHIACTDPIHISYDKFITDEVGYGEYESFTKKEKPFRMSNLNKLGTAATVGAAIAAIPGEVVELGAAALYGAYVGVMKIRAHINNESYSAKLPLMPYKTRMGDILDNLINDGATELTEKDYPRYKYLKINWEDSKALNFGPGEQGNTHVSLSVNEDTLHVSLSLYGKSSKEDGNLIMSVLSYADSHGLDVDYKDATIKSYFKAHKNDTWWDKTKESVSDLLGRKKD